MIKKYLRVEGDSPCSKINPSDNNDNNIKGKAVNHLYPYKHTRQTGKENQIFYLKGHIASGELIFWKAFETVCNKMRYG